MKLNTTSFQKGATKRVLAMVLSVGMVITSAPPITASEKNMPGEAVTLSGFSALPDEVREQTVALGISLEELHLPNTLEAVVRSASEDTDPPESSSSEGSSSGESSSGESSSGESSSGESSSGESSSGESSSGESSSEESSSEESSSSGEPSSENSEPDEPANEETQTSTGEAASGAGETVTQVLSDYVESDATETTEAGNAPATVTVHGVTWKSEPSFDGNTAGTYVFTAVLPDGYIVEDGAALPVITIEVQALPVWDGTTDTSWYDQTAESFALTTAAELAGLARLVLDGTDFLNKTVELMNDIDLGGLEWTPIGAYADGKDSKPFAGSLLGNRHTIHRLVIHQPLKDDLGLFGYSSGIIRDLNIKDAVIEGGRNVGGIAGVSNGIVEDCTVTGSVVGTENFADLVGLDLVANPVTPIDYAALVDVREYFLAHQEELSNQIATLADESADGTQEQPDGATQEQPDGATQEQPDGATQEQPDGATQEQPDGATQEQPDGATQEQPDGATQEQPDGATQEQPDGTQEQPAAGMSYVTGAPALEQLIAPVFGSFDVEKVDDGVQMTAGIAESRGQDVAEYGFVWSLDGTAPTLTDNAGIAPLHGGVNMGDFSHTLTGEADALVRAYTVYDGMVSYTGALTTDNKVEKGAPAQPEVYSAENGGGETLVFGKGGVAFDVPLIQIPLALWPMGTGFWLDIGDRRPAQDETVYVIIKGSIVGVPILDINGKHIGELESTANQEYYIIPLKGRDLTYGENYINILLAPVVPGWFYVDNIQFIFGGGPGVIDGSAASVDKVAFQGYNFSSEFARYDLTVDGVLNATNKTGHTQRMITSVTVSGNKMFASQKQMEIEPDPGQQTLLTNNKCSDVKIWAPVDGELTLAAAMLAKPPEGSAWAKQEPDEVVVSLLADTIQYEDNEGPHEYRIDFAYDESYHSTGKKGPLHVEATVESVFGLPISYIMLPGADNVPENKFENDSDEGITGAGLLKSSAVVPASSGKRVYGYSTAFDIATNGIYEFKVAGPGGVVESFRLEISNIDNQPPELELVGAAEMTMLEDTPFVELGYGGRDNRSVEENLVLAVEPPQGLNMDKPDGGEYGITYSAVDQAGNRTEAVRTLHIKNRPLDLVTESVIKSGTSVNMTGSIRYLGDETVVERGFVWDLGSAPTIDANMGKNYTAFEVHNKDSFGCAVALSSLIPNATYYARPYAKTSGKVVYGTAQSFTANSKNYGAFSITPTVNSAGNRTLSLTIKREGGTDGAQTVRWRTVDGSAIAGYHYQATGGTVTFAPGEASKNVSVKILPTPSSGLYRWEIAARLFYVELLSVAGGGNLNDNERVCKASCTDTDDKIIQRTNMNRWDIVSQNIPQGYQRFGGAAWGRRSYAHYPNENPGYALSKYSYWSEHGRVQGQQQLTINMKASDSGLDVFVRKNGQNWRNVASRWYDWGDGEKECTTGAFDLTGQDYVMGRGLSQVRVAWSWVELKGPRLSINYYDTDTPTLKQLAALSGDYKADDNIYFAARFNEIVTVANQQNLYMDIALDTGGTVTALYESGSGTDTIVFKMPVPENAKSAGVTATLQGEESYVADFSGKKSANAAGIRLGGVNISSMPYTVTISPGSGSNAAKHTVQITVAKPPAYAGAAAAYKYAFTNSQALDADGMKLLKPFNSGDNVTLAGGSGTFYLHVVISDSLGIYRTQCGPYEISNDLPAFTVSSSTNKWTKDSVRVFLTMNDKKYLDVNKDSLELFLRDNTGGTIGKAEEFKIEGATAISTGNVDSGRFYFDATENGSWALLARDKKSGYTYFSAVSVDCIDTVPPTAALAKSQISPRVTIEKLADYGYTAANPAVYLFCGDDDSGLAAAQYRFSASSATPADGWKLYKDGELVSVQGYFGKETSGSFYLHLRTTDKVGNVFDLCHGTPFVVPVKAPPTIKVEVEPLPAGLNGFGTPEQAYTAAELTASNPDSATLTGRSAWIKVTVKKSDEPGAGDLAALMLPGTKNIYDNNVRPDKDGGTIYVDGYEVKDLDDASGVISIRFPAEKNGIYRFMGTDINSSSTGFDNGTVIITGIDKNSPEISYGKYDKNGRLLLPSDWVKGEDGVTLKLSFSDATTPLYGKNDVLNGYTGSGGMTYQILQGGKTETGTEYKPYTDGSKIECKVNANDTFLVKVRDRIGNSYVQRIAVTNIDSTPPYVDTTNTSYGVALAPIKMQLKYADKEMGLCKVRKYAITADTNTPASGLLLDYGGNVLELKEPGTWYVHYSAQDDVGHVTEGYFGPYTVDSGKPAIAIDSKTSDEYVINDDGSVTYTFRDDRSARMHSAQVTVTYPLTAGTPLNETREYQWSQNTSPSLFGWQVAPTGAADAANGQIVRFDLDSWGSEGVSGRWYLHVRTKGTTSYRGFLFDNDLPVIAIIGNNPVYLPRGDSYSDRGATAVDAQDKSVGVTTKLTGKDGTVTDTRYIETDRPGQHVVTYTATDAAGNSSTAQRVVFIYDDKPPHVQDFAKETQEDILLPFTGQDFLDHFEDDSNKPYQDTDGTITQLHSLDRVRINSVPTHGILRLDGALLKDGDEIPQARLNGLAYHPNDNYNGTDSFTYQAYDTGIGDRAGNLSFNTATVSLTVASVNDAPAAANLSANTNEEAALAIGLAPFIADVEGSANLTVTLGALTAVKAATSNVTDPGTAAVSGQTITYTPAKDFNGWVNFAYTVTDAEKATATAIVTVFVANVNDAPVMSGALTLNEVTDDDKLYRGGQTVTLDWTAATDVDNDALTHRLMLTKPAGITEQIVAKLSGTSYEWTVPELDGKCTVTVIANDGPLDSNSITSAEFVIDSTKPVVNSITPNEHEWENEASIPVTTAVSDADCGQLNKTLITEYAVDTSGDGKNYISGKWAVSDSGTAVSAEGFNKVRVRVTDAAGNVSEEKTSGDYRLDRTAPAAFTALSSLNEVIGSDGKATTLFTVSGKTVDDTTARLGVSGMKPQAYEYMLDGGAYTTADNLGKHTFATALAPDTPHIMTIRATDIAGNVQTGAVTAYTRAQDAQTATLTAWNSGSLNVSFTAPANRAETVYKAWLTTRYGNTPIAETGYSADLTRSFAGLAEDTEYVLYIQSKNGSELENTPARFDKDSTDAGFKTNKKPVLTLNDNTNRYYKAGETITFTGTVEDTDVAYHGQSAEPAVLIDFGGVKRPATLTASTSLFGLLTSSTKWNWTVSLTVDTELSGVPDGRYTPTVTATDNITETGEMSFSEGVWLDRKTPVAPLITVTDANAQEPLIFSKEASVAAKLTEQGDTPTGTGGNANPSGFKALRYMLAGDSNVAGGGQSTGGKWVAAVSGNAITVTDEGLTTLTAQAEDNAGNLMESTTELYIDRTKPTQSTPPAAVFKTASYDGSWVSGAIGVTLTANDTVGVGKIYAKVTDNNTALGENEGSYDSNLTKTYSGSALEPQVATIITLNLQQQNYIHYMYVDTAGNKQTFVAGPYKIDTTAPAPVFAVNAKELTSDGNSVVLRDHGASVGIFDAGNTDSNPADLHAAGLTKAEFIWLPERVTEAPTTGDSVTVSADNPNPLPSDDANATFSWVEFTNGATLVQGGAVNGTWHLWVRLTDAAGNVKCYNEAETASRPADQKPGYPVFRFDNTAPRLPEKDGSGLPLAPGSVVNNKTYGSLDIKLPTDDDWFEDSNAGGIEYQYTFTTDKEPPPKDGLPVFKFESYTDFLAFPYTTTVTVDPAAGNDTLWSHGVTLAAEFMVMPGNAYHQFHSLLDMGGFKVRVSDVTGAIVVTDSKGTDKHLGGGYNDGRIHKLVVSAGFGEAIKVYADGKYLGRFWFPTITKEKLADFYTMGSGLNGQIYKATLFGRMADDDEGKSFIFRTNDIVGDYVFCAGLDGNVTGDIITDRSGQKNNATVNENSVWDRGYKSAEFLSEGAVNPKIDLRQYLKQYNAAKELTISTTFKTDKTTGADSTPYQFIFSNSTGGFNLFYIYLKDGELRVLFSHADPNFVETGSETGIMLADGQTHTVTVTAKGDKGMVYVDGKLVTTRDIGDWLTKSKPMSNGLFAGFHRNMNESDPAKSDYHYFNGTLYNTHLFARALTQDEIESGNINYLDKPIALLNYTKEQSGDFGNDFDSVVQTGEGMRFDDSGDYIDLGRTVDIIGDTADKTINATGFSTSVRFNADRARWTGQYYSSSSGTWANESAYEGQRLFTMLLGQETGNTDVANMGFGIKGCSDQLFYYWGGAAGDRVDTPVIDDLYGTEHYATLSYDAVAKTMTIYMDGVELAQKTDVTLVSTSYTESRAYVGVHLPPIAGNHPEGVAQFYGTIYNLNVKREPTTLTQHIEEAAKHVTTYTKIENLAGSYNLDEAAGSVLKPAAGTGSAATPAKLHGIGDAGIKFNGEQWAEFSLGSDIGLGDLSPSTFEVTYETPYDTDQTMIVQKGKNSLNRYLTINNGGSGQDGHFGYSTGGVNYPTPPPNTKARITAVAIPEGSDLYGYVYRDGVLVGGKTKIAEPTYASDATADFILGALQAYDFRFAGTMYDVKIWNKALTAEQVGGLAGYTYDDLVLHYDFAGSNPLKDKSGHGHDGTMNSAAPATTGLYPRFDGTQARNFVQTAMLASGGATSITLDTAFSINKKSPDVSGHNIVQIGQEGGDGGKPIPLWLRTAEDGSTINFGLNSTSVWTVPLNPGRTVHTVKGSITNATYSFTVDDVVYSGATPAGAQALPPSDGKVYLGNGVTGANMGGTLYKFNLSINGVPLGFNDGGKDASGAWVSDTAGVVFNPGTTGITWVPAPANIKGEYPEFLGGKAGTSYAETAAGLINYSSPFTFKMKLKPLGMNSADGWNTYAALGRDISNDSALPFFLASITNNNALTLYTSGHGGNGAHAAVDIGAISPAGKYDVTFTADVTAKTYSAVVNGAPVVNQTIPIPINGTLNGTDGTIYLANRLYPAQAGHFVLYEFEALQNGVTVCRYDGTRSWDGTRLIDVSGNGNDATIVGNVNWVTGTPESVDRIVAVPKGGDFTWVRDDLAKKGETIIDVSNETVQGKVYLHVWVRDALGNERQVTYGPFDYDTTRPEVSISARKPKPSGENATSGYVSMSVSDNWLLKNAPTRWATAETTSRLENPESLFASPAWQSFAGLTSGTANRSTATKELANVGASTNPAKYYVAVEAEDWLGNKTASYLYVDSSTLFDDAQAPAIKFTNIGKNTVYSKRQMVQVDVDDNPESGKTASGVNDQVLQYVWSKGASAPADGWASFNNHNTLRQEAGDGDWFLYVKAADNAGNNASGTSAEQKLDNTAPTIAPVRADGNWSKVGFTVNAGVADPSAPNAAGIAKIYRASGKHTVDYFAGGAVAGSGITDITAAGSFTASESGDYTIYAVDNAGNENIAVYTESWLDKIAPTVSLSPASGGWTKDSITVTVTPADAGGSGVALVSYTLNGTGGTLGTTGGTVTIDTQGENTLKATVTDGAGNICAPVTGVYKIDTAQNTISLTTNDTVAKSHSVKVTVGAADSGAAASVRYGWGQGAAPEYWSNAVLAADNTFTATRSIGDGAWTLFVESTSATGVPNDASGVYNFDNTAPGLALKLANEDWTTATTLAADSDGATLTVTVDGTTLTPIPARSTTANYPVDANGIYKAIAKDGAGNETTRSLTVTNIDTAAPTALLTPTGGGWFGGPVTVFAIASDTISGVDTITYTVDGGTAQPEAKLTTDGTHTVAATVTDRADNIVITPAQEYKLDSAAPTLAPAISAVAADSLTVAANAADVLSGIKSTTMTLEEDKAKVPTGGKFSELSANKGYTVNVAAADNAGNTATAQAAQTYTLAAVPTGLADVKVLSNGLTATLVPGTNAISPAYGIKIYKQGQAGTPLYTGGKTRSTAVSATFGVVVVTKGDVLFMEVTAYNEDGVGSAKTFTLTGSGGGITEVNEPPAVTVTVPAEATLLGAAGTLTLSGTVTDPNGGEITVTATIDGVTKTATVNAGDNWTLTWTAAELREGEHDDITVTATDDKGEQATAAAPTITVDKTPPPPPKVAIDAGWSASSTFTPAPGDDETDITYEYRMDNGTWTAYTSGVTLTGDSGEHTLEVRAVDKAGNAGQPTPSAVKLEQARPTVTINPAATGDWLTANTPVTVSFADDYKLTQAGWLISGDGTLTGEAVATAMVKAELAADGKTAAATVPIGKEDGNWYVYALAKDNAGETLKKSGPYKADKTSPTVPAVTVTDITKNTATLSGAEKITDAGADGVADGDSGLQPAATLYHYKTGTEQTSANGILTGLTPNALYDAWLTAADLAGNTATGGSARFCTPAADPVNVELTGRGKDFLTFAITGDAANATPPEYRIVLMNTAGETVAASDWSTSTTVRLPVPDSAWPVHGTIQTRNREKTENLPIELTKENFTDLPDSPFTGSSAPVITLVQSDEPGILHDSDSITLTGTVSDADGDALYVSATIDSIEKTEKLDAGTGVRNWTLTWNITADHLCAGTFGSYSNVSVTAMDPADNRADVTDTNTYRIDNAGPQAPAAVGGLPALVRGIDGAYTVNLTAGVDRGAAGIAGWSYTLDKGTPITGTSDAIPPIVVSGEGAHTLTARYTDRLGNAGAEVSFTFTVDSLAPTMGAKTLYTFDPANPDGWVVTDKQPGAGVWYNAILRADYSFSDGTVQYTLSDSAAPPADYDSTVQQGTTAAIAMTEGTHWVHLCATDEAGNVFTQSFGPYQVDLTAIAVTTTVDSPTVATEHTVTVKADASGDASGIATAEYLWSEALVYNDSMTGWGSFDPAGETVTLSGASGTWFLYAKAEDKAGNRTVERSDAVRMDNTPPKLTITKADDSTLRKEMAQVTAVDEHSMVTAQSYLEGSHTAADFAGAAGMGQGSVALTANGVYTFFAKDEAGNSAVKEYTVAGLDGGMPVITAEGPANVWNKEPFEVTITITDPDGQLDKVGIIDPQHYDLPVDDPNSTAAYMGLADINSAVSPTGEGIDTAHFKKVRDAADMLTDGKLTVAVGSGSGAWHYSADGSIMLHLAASDRAGNVSYASFGPYKLDNTAPAVTTDTPNTILTTLVDADEEGQYNFTGYAISDNLTKRFVPEDATGIKPDPDEDGVYKFAFDPAAMDNFTEAKTYPNAVTINVTDAAGNTTTVKLDCKVCDNLAPIYGGGIRDDSTGLLKDNYIEVSINPGADYTFTAGDFAPVEGNNRLNEPSLPLMKITLHTLPDKGTLLLNGTALTETNLPKDISWGDITAGKLVYLPNASWEGPDTAAGFLAMDSEGNQSGDFYNRTQVRIKAGDEYNPEYLAGLEALKKVHIITNVTPTLADVAKKQLPSGWSFTEEDTGKRLQASTENEGKQTFGVKFTPNDPQYGEMKLQHSFPVSTVSVSMGELDVVLIDEIGGTERLSAIVTVIGAPLSGDLAIGGMEWRSSCPEIVLLSSGTVGGSASVTATGDKKGVSMVGVAYKNGGAMLGYVLVKVIDDRDDSANTIDQIKGISDTLDRLVDKDNPSEGDKGAVNAVADEVTKLPPDKKKALQEEDVKALDELKNAVNVGLLTITLDETPEGAAPPAPTGVKAVGKAIACGVDTGTVVYHVTPVQPTGTDTKMELKLDMEIDSTKGNQLKAPLFFTMTLPSSVDVSKLKIKHVMESGSEDVLFTHSGQTVSFKLGSFSSLRFEVSGGGSGGGGGGGGDSTPAIPQKPDSIKPEPPVNSTPPATAGEGASSETTLPEVEEPMSSEEEDGGQSFDGSSETEKQKDPILDALADAIANLPGGLTYTEREAYVERLTELADASIAALAGVTDPAQRERILKQLQEEMAGIVAEAQAFADSVAEEKPFALLSALFALAAILSAAFCAIKKRGKRHLVPCVVCALAATATFLLTTGWHGFVRANSWTVLVAVCTIAALLFASGKIPGAAQAQENDAQL